MVKLKVEVELDELNVYENSDLIMGIFRKYIKPLKESEKLFLDSGGQSVSSYYGRCLTLLKRRIANGQLENIELIG